MENIKLPYEEVVKELKQNKNKLRPDHKAILEVLGVLEDDNL